MGLKDPFYRQFPISSLSVSVFEALSAKWIFERKPIGNGFFLYSFICKTNWHFLLGARMSLSNINLSGMLLTNK